MKWIKVLAVITVLSLSASWVQAEPKQAKKLTCCEKAFEAGKECRNKCCLAAHRTNKSCEKCNPEKQDLAVMKKLAEKKKQGAAAKK